MGHTKECDGLSLMGFTSFAAVGDSFTEGVGDELPDGQVRGWADLVAQGLAVSSPESVTYANLAIRGRLLDAILEEQLPAAIALKPQLLSLNGGGNDILRPRVSIDEVAQRLVDGAKQALDAGIHVILLSGANPSDHLPMGKRIGARGDALAAAVHAKIPPQPGLTFPRPTSGQVPRASSAHATPSTGASTCSPGSAGGSPASPPATLGSPNTRPWTP